jgi:hypothetical protein
MTDPGVARARDIGGHAGLERLTLEMLVAAPVSLPETICEPTIEPTMSDLTPVKSPVSGHDAS